MSRSTEWDVYFAGQGCHQIGDEPRHFLTSSSSEDTFWDMILTLYVSR